MPNTNNQHHIRSNIRYLPKQLQSIEPAKILQPLLVFNYQGLVIDIILDFATIFTNKRYSYV